MDPADFFELNDKIKLGKTFIKGTNVEAKPAILSFIQIYCIGRKSFPSSSVLAFWNVPKNIKVIRWRLP